MTAWEMREDSGAQMPPSLGCLSATMELGLDGPRQKPGDLHLGLLILQLLSSNHTVWDSLSLLVSLVTLMASLPGKATFVPSSLSRRQSVENS